MSYDISVNITSKSDSTGFTIAVQSMTTTAQNSTTTTVSEDSDTLSVAVLTALLIRAAETN